MPERSSFRVALLCCLALSALLVGSGSAAAQQVDDSGESSMLARINAMRAAQQLAPLDRHEGLDAAAHAHSVDMAMHRELVHVSERTGNPNDRLVAADVEAERISENIARRESTLEAHQSILESEAHRDQLLDPQMTHIGLAAVIGADGVYVTQLVARIESELPPDPASALPPPAIIDSAPAVEEVQPEPEPLMAEGPDPIAALVAQAQAQGAVAAEAPAFEADVEIEEFEEFEPEPVAIAPERPRVQIAPAPAPAPQATARAVQLPPPFRVPARHRGVSGYWVSHGGRWWYYPAPANALPGQLLSADPRVQGPPPGYGQPTSTVAPPPAPAPRTYGQVYISRQARRPGYYRAPSRVVITRR